MKMKYIFVILLLIPFFSIAQKMEQTDFIGKWSGEDNGEIGFITFAEDGFAFIEIGGQLMGGEQFTIKGEKASLSYQINTEVEPITVDFILKNLVTNEERTLYCIAKYLEPNSMQFAINFVDLRPEDFTDRNSIVLTKVE